jgi:hypothetical protein
MELPDYHPMNSTENIQRRSSFMNRWMQWPLLCGVLGLSLTHLAKAADSGYTNNAVISFPGTEQYPPQIDATNFVNNGSFTINFQTLTFNNQLFETSDTLNYINSSSMSCNTGFNFDNQSSSSGMRSMAASFNNTGTITCNSFGGIDFNNIFDILNSEELIFGFGQFNAWATNIVNPGAVDVGPDGLMQFSGVNVDLSRSTLTIESFGASASGSGIFGLNTNAWDASVDLGPTSAESTLLPNPYFELFLPNSTAYIQQDSINNGSNEIIRAVFIEDTSPTNVAYNVYFDSDNIQFGIGNVTIEWVGSYLDAPTGNTLHNYLYLNNDYTRSTATNLTYVNGIPDNFTFTSSSTSLSTGLTPAPAGFANVFLPGGVTNRYAYAEAQLISTSVGLNSIANGAITNLPARIQIAASNELDLSFAQLTGANYLSIQSPNQFDGSAGALIQSPYSDINVGVTNGFLTVSNLMSSTIPNWHGNVQAWSTRWLVSNGNGGTNDYRVLIVGSQLTPITLAQVQDLFLHGTNSIVISDAFNVMRKFTADAQNLTLTTNGPGNGSTSLDGELNLNNVSVFFQSSLPNLLNLTNAGAIRTLNLANFGSPLTYNVIPSVPAVAAAGMLSEAGTNFVVKDKLTIGTNQYVFYKTITNSVANQVKIASTFDGSMSNLIAAVNGAAGLGTIYTTATKSNRLAMAAALTNHAFKVTARLAGSSGNSIATIFTPATASHNLTWSNQMTLVGGADVVLAITNVTSFPYDNFINNGLVSDQGSTIYANNFVNGGTFSNGINSFILKSVTTTLTNSLILAGGDISITANNVLATNLIMQAGRSLTLQVTNLLTDGAANLVAGGVTNGNIWWVGGASLSGINLAVKPAMGDLLGTTITNIAPTNKKVSNTWAAQDFGYSTSGFTNNAAIGQLVIDAGTNGVVVFNGVGGIGISNAIYVDSLLLLDQATNRDNAGNPISLTNSPNMIIYYAQAIMNGVSVADKLNGKNNNHLRWISAYVGNFSATNLVINGVTNTVNTGLAQSTSIDSDGDGIPNAFDPTPFFTSGQVNLAVTITNALPPNATIQWQTIPGATNVVYYTTNLLSPNWLTLTNFVTPAAPPYAPITEVIHDAIGNLSTQKFYRVQVNLNTANLYGQ